MIREGKANRNYWRIMGPVVDFIIRHRLGPGKEVSRSLQRLDLTAEDLNINQPLGAYDLASAKVAHQQMYRVDANWKLCLENYLECYHCATSHRDYARMHSLKELAVKSQPLNDAMLARTEEVTGIAGMGLEHWEIYEHAPHHGGCVYTSRYALYEGYLTGSEDGQPVAPLMGDIKGYDGGAGDFQFGPVTFMLNYPDHCVLYRFIPRCITETDMQVVWFVRGDA